MSAATGTPTAVAAATAEVESLVALCGRVRPEMDALGDLAAPLVDVVGVVERVGRARGADALADPGFALDVLTAAPEADASLIGRVLDFLRVRSASPQLAGLSSASTRERVTLATAIERYEAGPLKARAKSTRGNYRTWLQRLSDEHGDSDPTTVTTGDLRDLIAAWVVKIREAHGDNPRYHGGAIGSERLAVDAYRGLFKYLIEKRWADDNVATALVKPALPESRRRPWRPEEAALIRQFARSHGRDGLLTEVMVSIAERMGLRREELYLLRNRDVNLTRRVASVLGKGGKRRDAAIPPVLAALLERYIEDRRPADVPRDVWVRSEEWLLRSRPTAKHPHGQRMGGSRPDALFDALRQSAPELFQGHDQSLHCYRHSLGTWVEARYGRKATRAVLGHSGRKESTDYYVVVTLEEQADILAEYEQYLLAADPTYPQAA